MNNKCWWFSFDKSCENPVDISGEHDPFCGKICHERYAVSAGPKNERGKTKLTIKEMQDRLLVMGGAKNGARLEQEKLTGFDIKDTT